MNPSRFTVVLLFLLFVLFTFLPVLHAAFYGMTIDLCRTSLDCHGTRTCYDTEPDEWIPCTATSPRCICYKDTVCETSSTACDKGEMCFTDNDPDHRNICISCSILTSSQEIFFPVDDTSYCEDAENNHGTSYDLCRHDATCRPPRTCRDEEDFITECSSSSDRCFCVSDVDTRTCETETDCDSDEICAIVTPTAKPSTPFCASEYFPGNFTNIGFYNPDNTPEPSAPSVSATPMPPTATPEPMTPEPIASTSPVPSSIASTSPVPSSVASTSPVPSTIPSKAPTPSALMISRTPDPTNIPMSSPSRSSSKQPEPNIPTQPPSSPEPCIAIHHLEHLPEAHRVFKTNRRASVLCDRFGSCATPGHMVVYNDMPLSMRSYCDLLLHKCVRKVMWVNSVSMSKRVRVDSLSGGMKFTAYAAKYETRLEELLLSLLVRLGV